MDIYHSDLAAGLRTNLCSIPNSVPISSEKGWNVDELLEMMWDKLDLKRIYTKPKGQQPDYTAPVVLRAGQNTVEDFVRSRSPCIWIEDFC